MCVEESELCDGVNDCGDNSDELFCTCETRKNLITCPGGSNFTDCIPKQWLCDGHSDCPGGSDERDCLANSIFSGKYLVSLNASLNYGCVMVIQTALVVLMRANSVFIGSYLLSLDLCSRDVVLKPSCQSVCLCVHGKQSIQDFKWQLVLR